MSAAGCRFGPAIMSALWIRARTSFSPGSARALSPKVALPEDGVSIWGGRTGAPRPTHLFGRSLAPRRR